MLLAMNSMLMNQQCILCSLSLNRSTYETRLCLVLVVVIGDTHRKLTLCFPCSSISLFVYLVFTVILQNIAIMKSNNALYPKIRKNREDRFPAKESNSIWWWWWLSH